MAAVEIVRDVLEERIVLGPLMKYAFFFRLFDTQLHQVVSTVLAKILPQAEKTSDLHALLRTSSNIIVLHELEPVLKGTG
jgi:hypothetical protein